MAKVGIIFKVYPEAGKEEELSKLISERMKPQGIQISDVAFGIKIIKVLFVREDEEGSSKLEEELKKLPNVSEVEVEEESLL
ncbi:MAG: hypothetical protein QXF41_02400 [Candidatus Micrarchaeaceae archaeon]